MKYVYLAGILVIVFILCILVFFWIRRFLARKRVAKRSQEEKCTELNRVLENYGFSYDLGDDSFYSTLNPWQRKTGYCRAYDEAALGMNMVLHCEPVYFEYGGRNYLLEAWKGQYGMACGAEVGIYVSDEEAGNSPQKLFYKCVTDEELIPMAYTVYYRGEPLLRRSALHWWLTGFRLGEWCSPDELEMDIRLTFPTIGMRNSFLEGLFRLGYRKQILRVEETTVEYWYGRPLSPQPKHFAWYVRFIQYMNRKNCRRFLRITRFYHTTLDRVNYIAMCFPLLYKSLLLFRPVKRRGRRT